MPIKRIISGGQTGADQGALYTAKELGLLTGGTIPHGFRTETGPRPDLAREFGLREHPSDKYQPRTRENVWKSDATLIFGNEHSPGCKLTRRYCIDMGKPFIIVSWISNEKYPNQDEVDLFKAWLIKNNVEILNVAGNREEKQPGVFLAVKDFLKRVLS